MRTAVPGYSDVSMPLSPGKAAPWFVHIYVLTGCVCAVVADLSMSVKLFVPYFLPVNLSS